MTTEEWREQTVTWMLVEMFKWYDKTVGQLPKWIKIGAFADKTLNDTVDVETFALHQKLKDWRMLRSPIPRWDYGSDRGSSNSRWGGYR